ncbi:MAG: hypothetical protein EZS28_044844, partial [Streblomastix strix]
DGLIDKIAIGTGIVQKGGMFNKMQKPIEKEKDETAGIPFYNYENKIINYLDRHPCYKDPEEHKQTANRLQPQQSTRRENDEDDAEVDINVDDILFGDEDQLFQEDQYLEEQYKLQEEKENKKEEEQKKEEKDEDDDEDEEIQKEKYMEEEINYIYAPASVRDRKKFDTSPNPEFQYYSYFQVGKQYQRMKRKKQSSVPALWVKMFQKDSKKANKNIPNNQQPEQPTVKPILV